MGQLLNHQKIIPIGVKDVTKRTRHAGRGKVDDVEYRLFMQGYFATIHDIFRLSYSNVYFGGRIYFILQDTIRMDKVFKKIRRRIALFKYLKQKRAELKAQGK